MRHSHKPEGLDEDFASGQRWIDLGLGTGPTRRPRSSHNRRRVSVAPSKAGAHTHGGKGRRQRGQRQGSALKG
jgi:hypothetical protein